MTDENCDPKYYLITQKSLEKDKGALEGNQAPEAVLWGETGLGFELRGHIPSGCLSSSARSAELSGGENALEMTEHKIIMQTQGILWMACSFTRYWNDSQI